MTAEVVASAGALVAGPVVLWLAHCGRTGLFRLGGIAAASVIGLVGYVTAAAVGVGRLTLVTPLLMFGLAAALVDVDERRLPNLLTGALTVGTTATLATVAVVSGDMESTVRSTYAAVSVGGIAALAKTISPQSIGWGDVKLLPATAATLAWPDPVMLYRGVVAWILLLLVTLTGWKLARLDPTETVPYGPAIVAGALGTLLVVA